MENNFNHTDATPLIPFQSIHSLLPLSYIKDESKNPNGTIKDRRNSHIVKEAVRLGVDKLVLITSGNNGYSLAKLAKDFDVKVVCIVGRDMEKREKEALSRVAYQVIELNLDHKILRPEELIAFARETDEEVIWDVTNGYEDEYASVLDEILEMSVVPDYIVVPVGSGSIYMGIIEAILRHNLKTKVIGVGIQNTIRSFADKLSTPWTPYAKALNNFHNQGHTVLRLNESEVKKTFEKYKNVIECEPSSSVVFSTIPMFKKTDFVVFLNTGKTQL